MPHAAAGAQTQNGSNRRFTANCDRRQQHSRMALSRSRLVRGALAQLRCSTALLDAPAAVAAAPMAVPPHMPFAPPPLAAPGAPPALAAARQHTRGISAATMLMAERQAGGSAPPPPPPAAGGSGVAAGSGSDEEELSDDEAADAMAEAFERLIQAAFEMVQQGKPMEAEYVLSEGAPPLPPPGSWWRGWVQNRCWGVAMPQPAMHTCVCLLLLSIAGSAQVDRAVGAMHACCCRPAPKPQAR